MVGAVALGNSDLARQGIGGGAVEASRITGYR
jgi:hypothetical protein